MNRDEQDEARQAFALTQRDSSALRTLLGRANAWLRVVDACLSATSSAQSLQELTQVWAHAVVEAQGFNLVGAFHYRDGWLEKLALIGPRALRRQERFAAGALADRPSGVQFADHVVAPFDDAIGLRRGMWHTMETFTGEQLVLIAGFDERMADYMNPPPPDGVGQLRMTGQHLVLLASEIRDRALLTERSAALEDAVKKLHTAQDELVHSERLRAIGQVAAGVAHEVNNPLSWVMGDLERARSLVASDDATAREEQRELLAGAIEGLDHIAGIIQELGRFSKASAQAPEVLDVAAVIQGVLRLGSSHFRQLERIQVSGAEGLLVRCRARHLRQMLLNLMVNAVDAQKGRPGASVHIQVEAQSQMILIRVVDAGPGVPRAMQERLFEPFVTGKGELGGTGLGLSVARQLAFDNGGRLELEATGPTGTTFRIELPAGKRTPDSGRNRPVVFEREVPDRLRVLIIDDDARVLRVHVRRLGRFYDVHSALGGQAGLEALESGTYDAVLCDLMMPDIDGMTVRSQALARWPELESRFFFVSGGVTDESDRLEIERLNLVVIPKPIDLENLHDLLETIGPRPANG